MTQLVNNAAKGEHRSTQLALTLLGNASALPEPRKPEHSAKGDALVVAEIVRRLSRRPPSKRSLGLTSTQRRGPSPTTARCAVVGAGRGRKFDAVNHD